MAGFSYTARMSKDFSPARLDVRAYAKAGGHLEGEAPLSAFPRLAADAAPHDGTEPMVRWQADGELVTPMGGAGQAWLHLRAAARLPMICQRCLGPALIDVEADRRFRFVADEATAELEDDEAEEDVLALSRDFDLLELIEDELLMALPVVPRHEECPVPVKLQAGEADLQEAGDAKPNPFAALQALKTGKGD